MESNNRYLAKMKITAGEVCKAPVYGPGGGVDARSSMPPQNFII